MSAGTHQVGRILLIAAEEDGVGDIRGWLVDAGYDVGVHSEADAAFASLGTVHPDAVLLSSSLRGIDGLEALARIRRSYPNTPVVMLLSDATPRMIGSIMQAGAYDYLRTPVANVRLLTVTRNAIERGRMTVRLLQLEREATGRGYDGLIGSSAAMRNLFRQLDQLASSEVSILLLGESGTGKELVARSIHANSGRKAGPFVALNCAAIAETLQESELFGHERGAFTGAMTRRAGKFELASGGTLFLDEVAELSPSLQAKLLRALQERRFYRVGGDVEIRSDFRLVAASHRDLLAEVRAGRFREDLYFRIAVYELEIPPLRDRADDLMLLAEQFVRDFAGGRAIRFAPEVVELMRTYRWPGNVRELQNAMQRAVVSCAEGIIRTHDLPRTIRGGDSWIDGRPPDASGPGYSDPGVSTGPVPRFARPTTPWAPDEGGAPGIWAQSGYGETPVPRSSPNTGSHPIVGSREGSDLMRLDELERQAIERALIQTGGQITEACRVLGISRATMYRKLEKFGLR